jgi:3-oxoacyl-[acyl-carrier protein] reductase
MLLDRFSLTDKVAIVTGAGRGIGAACALGFAEAGADVVIASRTKEQLEDVANQVADHGRRALGVPCDVSDLANLDLIVDQTMNEFGRIDIVVNNAGYTWDGVVHRMTDEQFQAMLDVHLVAPFRILRAAAEPIRIMAKKEAEAGREVFRKVVNISSIAGLYGNAGQASYSSAKASLVGLTRTMCKEWGRYKVNVNCVAFGLINTRLTQPIEAQQKTIDVAGRDIKVGVQPQMLDAMARMIPLGRGGTPEEAADAVYLFCSPESNYISGQVIVAGGGLLI